MGWIEVKSAWLGCPHFADVFEGFEALGGLQPPPIIVGAGEVMEVRYLPFPDSRAMNIW